MFPILKTYFLAALFSALFFHAADANAGIFDIGVGLDDETRDLIEKMPVEIRVQVEILIKNALPLIDASVFSYLEKVDQILANRLSQIDCILDGTGKTAVEEIFAQVKPWKLGPTIIGDLRSNATKLYSKMDKHSTPEDFRVRYADLLNNAHTVACAVKATPVAEQEVMNIRISLTSRVRPWVRLRSELCVDARGCLVLLRTRTYDEIAAADLRDTNGPNSKNALDEIKVPSDSLFAKFDAELFESNIRKTYIISDVIKIRKIVREENAKVAFANAAAMVSGLELAIRDSEQALGTSSARIKQAIAVVNGRGDDAKLIQSAASATVELSNSQKVGIDILLARTGAVLLRIPSLLQELTKSLDVALKREERIVRDSTCARGNGGCRPDM